MMKDIDKKQKERRAISAFSMTLHKKFDRANVEKTIDFCAGLYKSEMKQEAKKLKEVNPVILNHLLQMAMRDGIDTVYFVQDGGNLENHEPIL